MKGFGLIEIIVASAIIAGALTGLAATARIASRSTTETAYRAEARMLAEEALEAVRTIRDTSWSAIQGLSAGAAYYPVFSIGTNTWTLESTDPGLIDGIFQRTVHVNSVYRDDTTDDITSGGSGTYEDTGTRKVTARVLWGESSEEVLSFENGTTDEDLSAFPSDNAGDGDPAQSFTVPSGDSVTVSSAALLLKKVPGTTPSDIYLEIRSGSTVGTVLATSGTINAGALSEELTWTSFSFGNPPVLSADTQYFMRLRSSPPSTELFSGSEGRIHWGYAQASPSLYVDGTAWRYVGRNGNESDEGQQLSQYDFSFRVHKEVVGAKSVELQTYIADIFGN